MTSITTKYGTKIDTTGLTPEQVARVRAVAENNGAYGAKGAALADTMRKRNSKATNPATPATPTTPTTGGGDPNMDNTGGNTDPGTTGLGNTGTTVDNFLEGIFSNFKPLDTSGAPKILTADDLEAQRQTTQDALYRQRTQNLERNRGRDLEAQKQELAERGIPLNFANDPSNPNNLYARAIGDVNDRYNALDREAMDAAITGADQRMATQASVNKTAYDAFMSNAQANYQSQLDAAAAGSNALQVLMSKYGLTQEAAQRELDRKMQEKIAKLNAETTKYVANKSHSGGGGGGGGGDGGPIFAGGAPGFNV